jgi:hypothetical protein
VWRMATAVANRPSASPALRGSRGFAGRHTRRMAMCEIGGFMWQRQGQLMPMQRPSRQRRTSAPSHSRRGIRTAYMH